MHWQGQMTQHKPTSLRGRLRHGHEGAARGDINSAATNLSSSPVSSVVMSTEHAYVQVLGRS